MTLYSCYLSKELQNLVDPVIQRNSFFGHPENLLIAMISDERLHIRELEILWILKAWLTKSACVCKFLIPKTNLDAYEYYDIIDSTQVQPSEPPFTMNSSDVDIHEFVNGHQITIPYCIIELITWVYIE